MQLNTNATFDCLALARQLQKRNDSFAIPEIHLFAYLSCLLWLYKNQAVADWGYAFVGTELGAPFCLEIDQAAKILIDRGYFHRIHDRFQITKLAERHLQDFSELTINSERLECLDAACASISAFSVGMVRNALSQEPELSRAHALPSNRHLLEETSISQLYTQFDALRSAINRYSNDLRLPAVVWLTALQQSSESTYVAA